MLGRSCTVNVDSIVPALKYFAIVLRDALLAQCHRANDVLKSLVDHFVASPLTALGDGSILNGNYATNRLNSA